MRIKLSASFDDGSMYDLRMADLMYRHAIPTTFYIPVNYVKYLHKKGIPAIPDTLLRQIAENFELGSHGVNHELLTQVDEQTQNKEIEQSKIELEQLFNKKISKFCYPRGYYNDAIKSKVSKVYDEARTVKVGNLDVPTDKYERPTTVHVGYDRKEYGTDWLTYGKEMADRAVEMAMKGQEVDFHIWGHSQEVDKNDQWDNLVMFLEYLDETIR